MYIVNKSFLIEPGFRIDAECIEEALLATNLELLSLPPSLYKCIDYKTVSSMVGALFCDAIATLNEFPQVGLIRGSIGAIEGMPLRNSTVYPDQFLSAGRAALGDFSLTTN